MSSRVIATLLFLFSIAVLHSAAEENNIFSPTTACEDQDNAINTLHDTYSARSNCKAKIVSTDNGVTTAAAESVVPFAINNLVCYGMCGPCGGCDKCGRGCKRELLAGGPYDWVPFKSEGGAEDYDLAIAYDEDCENVPDNIRDAAEVIGSSECIEAMNNGDDFLGHYSDMCQNICPCPDLPLPCACVLPPEPLPCACLPCDQRYEFADKSTLQPAVNLWTTNQEEAEKVYGGTNCWDTSQVTDMSSLFEGKTTFNNEISCWDTAQVTDMSTMFTYATSFNSDISEWVTSQVTDMAQMFLSASAFNNDISEWDTSKVTSMNSMFANAAAFTQQLCWDVKGKDTNGMFVNAGGGCIIESSTCCPASCTQTGVVKC